MAERQVYRLGDLQLRIMQVLWNGGPSTVAQVQDRLDGEPLAYTTVATMLRKIEDRGLVRHEAVDRRFVYEAAVNLDAVTRNMTADLVDRLFRGSMADAVSHLLESREVSPAELARLEAMIQQRRRASSARGGA